MTHYFVNRSKNLVSDFVNECLSVIEECCATQKDGHLHFNHEEYLFIKCNKEYRDVPFLHQQNGKDIELYSEDGWFHLEDIANWADIAIDIVKSIASNDAKRYGY